MHSITAAILADNKGRDGERLGRKLAALRADVFAFFRGTAPSFYRALNLPKSLLAAPKVLACGDLHLENFGSYKGDNRLVYFDLNDFDEACVAPLTFEVVRFLGSIFVAAKSLKIARKDAELLAKVFLDRYCEALITTKPRWVERSTATGPVKELLQSVRNRHRIDLVRKRTEIKKGKVRLIVDGSHALKASDADRAKAESILTAYASTQPDPAQFDPIDIARRIAGCGSLGLERYVVLVRGSGAAEGGYLMDIKRAASSSLAANIKVAQPAWRSDAERVVWLQRIGQAIPPALLGAVGAATRSYVIRELQPTADRINLRDLVSRRGALADVVRAMAETSAWAHLRGASRFGADSADALGQYAQRGAWRKDVLQYAYHGCDATLLQWQEFSADYDRDASLQS
ncbi:MAG: DUF2252 family protein [Betaproteobacteria bacterium]|nr:DUF2252 family protein [Betaproteobacteria bacterium]